MKTFGIILLSLVGLFVLMMIVGSLIGEHDRTEEAKIPWADMSFLVSGGEVMANNKEAYDLKDCTIIQYTGSADYWSAEHISIPAKKSSAGREPSSSRSQLCRAHACVSPRGCTACDCVR
jgi:hypothetical protein